MSDELSALAQRIARRRWSRNWVWYFVLSLPIFGFYLWGYWGGGAVILSIVGDLGLAGFLVLGFLALLSLTFSLRERAAGRHESVYRYQLAFSQFLLLIVALQAGQSWIKYLKERAPRVVAEVRSWDEKRPLSIVMPGTAGILAYVGDDEVVTYIPWSEITELKSAAEAADE